LSLRAAVAAVEVAPPAAVAVIETPTRNRRWRLIARSSAAPARRASLSATPRHFGGRWMRRSTNATESSGSRRWSTSSRRPATPPPPKCLADHLDALVVHLRCPARQRRRWRSTNLLEGSLGEVKRRAKVIGRVPGETSCLTLVWAVLDLYTDDAHVSCAKPLGAR
jgi:transposase-like protein